MDTSDLKLDAKAFIPGSKDRTSIKTKSIIVNMPMPKSISSGNLIIKMAQYVCFAIAKHCHNSKFYNFELDRIANHFGCIQPSSPMMGIKFYKQHFHICDDGFNIIPKNNGFGYEVYISQISCRVIFTKLQRGGGRKYYITNDHYIHVQEVHVDLDSENVLLGNLMSYDGVRRMQKLMD